MENNVMFKRPDTYRQSTEADQSRISRILDSFCIKASQELCNFLKKEFNCDNSKTLKHSHKLEINEDNSEISGDATFQIETFHDGDTKILDIPVKVSNNKLELPSSNIVKSVLNSATAIQTLASLNLKKEIEDRIEKINKHEEFKRTEYEKTISKNIRKTAASVTAPGDMYSQTLKINKHFLPEGIKVGDVLYVDSAKYRVVNGDEDKLSVEGTGVYWTLSKVMDIIREDEQIINVENKF